MTQIPAERRNARWAGVVLALLLAGIVLADAVLGDAPSWGENVQQPPVEASNNLAPLVKRLMPGVVTLVAFNPELAMPGVASGYFMAPDLVVSARHALVGMTRAEVRTSNGTSIPVAGIVAAEPSVDLVIVRLEKRAPGAVSLAVAATRPAVGERLLALGSPLGLELTASDGMVSAWRQVPQAGLILQHTVPVSVGSSGCALFNLRGEVVAIQTAILTVGQQTISAGQGLNFASAAERLNRMIAGPTRPLEQCAADFPHGWVPLITSGIDALSLYPMTRDDFRDALPFFEQETQHEPDEPDVWFRLGVCYEKLGQRQQSIAAYVRATALHPASPIAYNNLGVAYTQEGKYELAVEALDKAIQIRPRYTEAMTSLSLAELLLKHYPQAIAAARHALEVDPKLVDGHFYLGRALLESGDGNNARAERDALAALDKAKADELSKLIGK